MNNILGPFALYNDPKWNGMDKLSSLTLITKRHSH